MYKRKYRHPLHFEGADSHVPHREKIVSVAGGLATKEELHLSETDFHALLELSNRPMSERDLALLRYLRVRPLAHVPVNLSSPESYLKNNSVFLGDVSSEDSSTAFSYPTAGRAVTVKEGFVTPSKEVYLYHDIKGVGKALSAPVSWSKMVFGLGSHAGLSRAVNLRAVLEAKRMGFMTGLYLPPIRLREVVLDKKKVPSERISGDNLFAIQRLFASDYRISSLIPVEVGNALSMDDLVHTYRHLDLVVAAARSRVKGYLKQCEKIDAWNASHNTSYSLGISFLLNQDYSYESYARAFRSHLCSQLALMTSRRYWHDNLTIQNITVGGELDDWDRVVFIEDNRVQILEDETLTAPEWRNLEETELCAPVACSLFAYDSQVLVDTFLCGKHTTLESWWRGISGLLHTSHPLHNMDLAYIEKNFNYLYSHFVHARELEKEAFELVGSIGNTLS